MTRQPEYDQVAQWLHAINDDPGPEFLQELRSGYDDIKYAIDNGLTLDRYTAERRHALAERARRALAGIDLAGKSTAQIAGEYHARQVAECAHHVRDLEERIRALESGDFPVPAWCAEDAARDGISLAEAIERYRQDEIHAAAQALDHLDQYAVAGHEIQAYWAGRGTTGLPPHPSLDFPGTAAQGIPARPPAARRAAGQPARHATRPAP